MTNGNDSAFARSGFAISPEDYDTGESGLTKREYFAAMAMQAFCSHPVMGEHAEPDEIAATAVEQADALIDELNKEK